MVISFKGKNKRKKIRQKFANYAVNFLVNFQEMTWIFFHCGSRIRISIKIKWILSTSQGIYRILLVGFILEMKTILTQLTESKRKG